MFWLNCGVIFRLIFEQVDWNHYQLYTPPFQKSAWRWSYNWAETCSCNYNL